jgi:hypothetical protein
MKPESEKILVELLDDETSETRRAELLRQINEDSQALKAYHLIVNSETFIDQLPIESPSQGFNDGVLLGFKRIKTRENNNRLMTYFVGVAAAIVALIFVFAGESATPLPASSSSILEQISEWVPNWSITINPDSLLQLVLVLNAGLLIVLIEKIVSKRKVLSLHSFV